MAVFLTYKRPEARAGQKSARFFDRSFSLDKRRRKGPAGFFAHAGRCLTFPPFPFTLKLPYPFLSRGPARPCFRHIRLVPYARNGFFEVWKCFYPWNISERTTAGAEDPDTGNVTLASGARLGYLSQDPAYDPDETVLDYVLSHEADPARHEAQEILNRLGLFEHGRTMGTLSGGQRKRAALARCLVTPADVLVLDEPTNHLDIAMTEYLEHYLERFKGALLFVSHDRYFLEKLARHTAEVTFGRLFVYQGGYTGYLKGKAEREEHEAAAERKRRSVLKRELIWILQGPCARGTKSRERLERYAALKAQLPPERDGVLEEIDMPASRLGKKTIELRQASVDFDGETVLPPFDFTLLRDDRCGILGLNGCGKSTLLNLMAGELAPTAGTAVRGETVKIGYFRQHWQIPDGDETALAYVKERGESIETGEGRISAVKLMEMFLFSRETQYTPVSKLSGGEKRRLYLLGLLAEAPNVLLLDEPTNDLDIPTLQVLEEYLRHFPGAVVAVSHDRYFLDRICRRLIMMERGKAPAEHTGGDAGALIAAVAERPVREKKEKIAPERPVRTRALRFTYKEQREYETIDADIAALEEKLAALQRDAEAAATDYIRLQEIDAAREETEARLEEKMERWVYLNDLAERINGGCR